MDSSHVKGATFHLVLFGIRSRGPLDAYVKRYYYIYVAAHHVACTNDPTMGAWGPIWPPYFVGEDTQDADKNCYIRRRSQLQSEPPRLCLHVSSVWRPPIPPTGAALQLEGVLRRRTRQVRHSNRLEAPVDPCLLVPPETISPWLTSEQQRLSLAQRVVNGNPNVEGLTPQLVVELAFEWYQKERRNFERMREQTFEGIQRRTDSSGVQVRRPIPSHHSQMVLGGRRS